MSASPLFLYQLKKGNSSQKIDDIFIQLEQNIISFLNDETTSMEVFAKNNLDFIFNLRIKIIYWFNEQHINIDDLQKPENFFVEHKKNEIYSLLIENCLMIIFLN